MSRMSDSQRSSSKLYLSRAGQSSVNETADGKLTKNSVNERQKPIIFKSLTNEKEHFKKFTAENVMGVFQNNSDFRCFLCLKLLIISFNFNVFKRSLFIFRVISL